MGEVLLAIILPPALFAAWAAVQFAWQRHMTPDASDSDALAVRGGCGSCTCTTTCLKSNPKESES